MDLYYHLHNDDSQTAMKALATDTFDEPVADAEPDADPEHSVESPF